MYPPPPRKPQTTGASITMPLWLACCTTLYLKPSPWLTQKAQRDLGWLPAACHKRALGGFTLAELLICLAILGVIATFVIPKIIISNQNQQYNSVTKEAIASVAAAYSQYKLEGGDPNSWTFFQLTSYMNYTCRNNNGVCLSTHFLDQHPSSGFSVADCHNFGVWNCIGLANGASIYAYNGTSFTYPVANFQFWVDPNGRAEGDYSGAIFYMNSSGRIYPASNANSEPSWLTW